MTGPFGPPRVPGERSQSPGNSWQKAGLLTIGSSANNTLAKRQGAYAKTSRQDCLPFNQCITGIVVQQQRQQWPANLASRFAQSAPEAFFNQ